MDIWLNFNVMFVMVTAVIVPVALARWWAATSWPQIGCACVIWKLVLWSMIAGLPANQDPMSALVYVAMFYGWAVIPVVALIFRLNNLPDRFIARMQAARQS